GVGDAVEVAKVAVAGLVEVRESIRREDVALAAAARN
ncbi:MAG: hypothetical protein RL385_435, partial [Pseudomonadota bacterium]